MGVLTAASATGQLIFLPLMAWLAERYGWRSASLLVSVAALAVVPLVLHVRPRTTRPTSACGRTGRRRPPSHTEPGARTRPDAAAHRPADSTRDRRCGTADPRPDSWPAGTTASWRSTARARSGAPCSTLLDAARTRTFWALAIGFGICGATTNGLIGTHFVPAAHDHGMPTTTAAGLLALVGIFDIVGTVASGALTDRVNPRILLAVYYALRGVGLLMLPSLLSDSRAPEHPGVRHRLRAGLGGDRAADRGAVRRGVRRRPARSCSAGCSPRTRSARRWRRPVPVSFAT